MIARDIMTTEVAAVGPDATLREIARVLAAKGVSAVPVVDARGAPIGMVSEGDLIGRSAAEREARRDWWLAMLAEGEALHPDYLASLRHDGPTARAIMSAPVVTVSETTDIAEIARLLDAHRIKRVPVVRDGRLVGIVSRADLVRALAAPAAAEPGGQARAEGLFGAISALDERLHAARAAHAAAPRLPQNPAPAAPITELLTARRFNALMVQYRDRESRRREEIHAAAAEHLRERVKDLAEHHIDDARWQTLLARAIEAAEHGEKEILLLRFPNALCSDGGRAVNAPLPDWPGTLRGEPAELYLRWERDLKPHGFHLSARILEFPGGFPGDIGLFLGWTE